MKIGIEARALGGSLGVRSYVEGLIGGLSDIIERDSIHVWHTGYGRDTRATGVSETYVPLPTELMLPLWLNYLLPRSIRQRNPDVIHFTKADVPGRKLSVPTVVTVYDVIPLQLPETQTFVRRQYWPRAFDRVATQTDHIITISGASKRYLTEHLDVTPEDVTVIPLAVDTGHFKPTDELLPGMPDKYILFVGRWDMRKNIPALIQAFDRISHDIPHNLVIAGRRADKTQDLNGLVKKLNLTQRVLFLEDVPFEDLPALYAGADVFVYPSVIEGWGFPPQEAMACGTPVIVSNADPLCEVVGDAGRVVPYATDDLSERFRDQQFVDDLAAALSEVLSSSEVRDSMTELGLRRTRNSSWTEVAKQTLEVYRSVVK